MARILIADDHPIVRQGLKQIISETDDLVVAGEASTGQEVLEKISKFEYDVVLLDVSMPGGTGMDILKKFKTLRPNLPILVISIHPEKEYASRMFKLGVSGYLKKDSAPEEILDAVRRICRGKKCITSSLAEILVGDYSTNTERPPHESLSNREYEIMRLIASGKTAKDVAKELSLSKKTVHTHRSHILKKMNMKSDSELIYYAAHNQLVD